MKKGSHHTEATKKQIAEKLRGENNHNYGKCFSQTTRQKMSKSGQIKIFSQKHRKNLSIAHKGENHPLWKGGKKEIVCKICGKKRYDDPCHINQSRSRGIFCSLKCSAIYRTIHQKKQNTDIERLMEDELIRRNIPYTKQIALLGITIVDFLLPIDIVVYCDGDYWHGLPHTKKKDAEQNFILTFYGYKVFRFKGSDIKKSAKKCVDKILDKNIDLGYKDIQNRRLSEIQKELILA